ncbi:ATP-binding protein [Actinoplanes sp. NPDC051470]|uniref:ATP-binding protein n=1 Tax=unclassified Actinoplanes TaxID=2626549 RepID=UPI00342E6C74
MSKSLIRESVSGEHAELVSIVASSHDAIVGMTIDGLITTWNPAAVRLYGYAAEDIVGRSADLLVPAECRPDEAGVLRRILAGEEVGRYRSDRVCRDGSTVTVSLTVSPIVDDTGAVVGAATFSRWFNELEEARDRFEIRMSKLRSEAAGAAARFETLAEEVRDQARQAQERFDLRVGKERVRMQDAEDQVQAQLAMPGAQIGAGQMNREMQSAHERFEGLVAGQQTEAQSAAGRFETQVDEAHHQTEDAQQRFEEIVDHERVEAEDAADRFQQRTELEQDVARRDRQHLEFQLQQSQRLEVLGQLAGGVAHDFNNLLAVILNYASFVAEELAAAPASDSMTAAGHDVGQIQRAAERATALTHQLLAFARREVIQPRVLDLNHIITDVKQLLDRTIGEDVVLTNDLADDLWPILADTGQMEQILVNLVVNARNAMSGGGTLSIETRNIRVDDDRHIRLRVSDTGTGMSPDIIEHVFEPFYTTKRDGTGTGLGLATVYGIVAQAEGTIAIDSQLGVGTTMTMTFPVTDQVAVPDEAEVPYQHTPTGQTVLLVEDEQALREVTERIFTRDGYRVLTAADGQEALTIAADHDGEIDLLVTDVVMPMMLGKEVAERMLQIRPGIKVLYISGYARPVLASAGRLDPDMHLIEKPYSASTITQKAGQVLRHPG